MVIIFLFSHLGKVGFDSGFATLGIKDDKYLDAIKQVDEIFDRNKKIVVEVIPQEGDFVDIQQDMRLWEEQLNQEFDTLLFRSWVKVVSLLYTNKQLKKMPRDAVFERFSDIELFHNLVGDDKKSFLVILEIPSFEKSTVLEKYERSLKNTDFRLKYTFHVTSEFHLEDAVNTSVVRDVKRIIGLIFLFFVIVMLWAYQSVFAMIYLVINVLISMLVALVVHTLVGVPLNLITILVIPVMIVLSSSDAIHLLTGFYAQDRELSVKDRVKNVYQKYLTPSLLTSLSTAVAFFSLMFNKTESVYTLGWITGISVLIAFLLCIAITPLIFRFAKPKNIESHNFINLANFFIDRRKLFSFILIPMLLVALLLLPKLTYKTNFEIFIPSRSEAKIQHDLIRANFSSEATMDILLQMPDSANRAATITTLAKKVAKNEFVHAVMSSQTKSIVVTKYMVSLDFAIISGYVNQFSADSGKIQRLQISVKDPNKIIAIEREIKDLLGDLKLKDYTISSNVLIYNNVNKEVGRSLFQSLLSSSIFLFLLFLLLTRSFLLSAIGLFANLVPLSLIVIIFIGFDLHINIMTAMTAVVCLGIIVDDTIHSFYRRVVLKEKLKELSFGMLTTTLLLILGFGVFTLSDVKPMAIFGAVAAVVFLITLLSDFTLLLYLIDTYDRYFGKKLKDDGGDK